MTIEERIERCQKMIDEFKDDIEWMRKNQFSINGDQEAPIKRQERNIEMYQRIIEYLERQKN